MADAFAEITSWDSYAPTALHDLPDVAAHLGMRRVVFKDESTRFGWGPLRRWPMRCAGLSTIADGAAR